MVLAAVSFDRGICHICIMHCKLFQRFSSPHLFIHSRHDIAVEMMMLCWWWCWCRSRPRTRTRKRCGDFNLVKARLWSKRNNIKRMVRFLLFQFHFTHSPSSFATYVYAYYYYYFVSWLNTCCMFLLCRTKRSPQPSNNSNTIRKTWYSFLLM